LGLLIIKKIDKSDVDTQSLLDMFSAGFLNNEGKDELLNRFIFDGG
jgi:hypothetical protein